MSRGPDLGDTARLPASREDMGSLPGVLRSTEGERHVCTLQSPVCCVRAGDRFRTEAGALAGLSQPLSTRRRLTPPSCLCSGAGAGSAWGPLESGNPGPLSPILSQMSP